MNPTLEQAAGFALTIPEVDTADVIVVYKDGTSDLVGSLTSGQRITAAMATLMTIFPNGMPQELLNLLTPGNTLQ